MKRIFLFLGLLSFFPLLPAQQTVTLSGYVRDGSSGEAMIGATIYVPQIKSGAYTNEYGFYSLTLPTGKYQVQYRFVGYQTDTTFLDLLQDIRRDVELQSADASLTEVVISSQIRDENVSSTEMGATQLSIGTIKKIPVMFGETDVLKSIQLLPGVKPAGEGGTGFYVRGGGSDQNLILLDEAPVYNPSHLLGFFSVFNGDAIKSTKLYKGNMPAEYGGRLSSSLDVRMKEGNSKEYKLSGGIGLISSRLTFEGPIVEDKASFMVSGRRTYADAFLALSADTALKSSQLYFYDLNLKANYLLGEKDQLFLSGYFGRDKFGFRNQFGIDWGNATATMRWNHLFNDKLFLNSSFIYSDYNYDINLDRAGASISSGIQDFNIKEDLSWYASAQHTLKFGVNAIYHTFIPGVVQTTESASLSAFDLQEKYALESAAYISHDWSINEKFKINTGLRASGFTVLGPGTTYTYNKEGQIQDSTKYSNGEIVENYVGLEPRISARWALNPMISLKASYARNRQYIHLLSNSTSTTPTDVWLPSTEIIQPEIADQFAIGYYHNFERWNEEIFELSVEAYYKNLQNQIDYQEGADLLLNETVESQLVFGKGWAYGVELMLKKSTGKFSGWVSYNWSRSWRAFEEINEGNPFPARQDRIHDISLVAMYEPNPAWSFSGSWVYYTGDAVSFPAGSYFIDGQVAAYYTERNGYRMPDYHRMDLSANWYGKNPNSYINLSIYNAYNRKNAYTIDFRASEENPGTTEAVKTWLFGIVPSISWNFEF